MGKGRSTRYILYQPHFSQHLCGEDSEYSKEYFHLGFGQQSSQTVFAMHPCYVVVIQVISISHRSLRIRLSTILLVHFFLKGRRGNPYLFFGILYLMVKEYNIYRLQGSRSQREKAKQTFGEILTPPN